MGLVFPIDIVVVDVFVAVDVAVVVVGGVVIVVEFVNESVNRKTQLLLIRVNIAIITLHVSS